MRIQIWQYVIKSDGVGWATGIPTITMRKLKDGSEEPEEQLRAPLYHATLSQALQSLLDRSLRDSDCRSLRDVARHIEEFKKEVAELFEVEQG